MNVGAERPQFSQHSFPESADTLAGAAHYAVGRRHLESREQLRPSRLSPSQPAQVWYGLLEIFDRQSNHDILDGHNISRVMLRGRILSCPLMTGKFGENWLVPWRYQEREGAQAGQFFESRFLH